MLNALFIDFPLSVAATPEIDPEAPPSGAVGAFEEQLTLAQQSLEQQRLEKQRYVERRPIQANDKVPQGLEVAGTNGSVDATPQSQAGSIDPPLAELKPGTAQTTAVPALPAAVTTDLSEQIQGEVAPDDTSLLIDKQSRVAPAGAGIVDAPAAGQSDAAERTAAVTLSLEATQREPAGTVVAPSATVARETVGTELPSAGAVAEPGVVPGTQSLPTGSTQGVQALTASAKPSSNPAPVAASTLPGFLVADSGLTGPAATTPAAAAGPVGSDSASAQATNIAANELRRQQGLPGQVGNPEAGAKPSAAARDAEQLESRSVTTATRQAGVTNAAGSAVSPATLGRSLASLQGQVITSGVDPATRAAVSSDDSQSALLQAAWRGRLRPQTTETAARTPVGEQSGSTRIEGTAPGTAPVGAGLTAAPSATASIRAQGSGPLGQGTEPNPRSGAIDMAVASGSRVDAGAASTDGQSFGEILRPERQDAAADVGRLDLTRPAQTAERLTQVLQAQSDGLRGEGPLRILRLALNPASLGEMDVQFAQNERGEVAIRITTASAVTREVLEPHLAKVRSNLEELGLRLGAIDVQVAQQDARQAEQQRPRQDEASSFSARSEDDRRPATGSGSEQALTPSPAPLNRLLDTFA